jgi:hypothetical protein
MSQAVHKTKHRDDSPIVEEQAVARFKRAELAIRASQDAVRKSRELVKEALRIKKAH